MLDYLTYVFGWIISLIGREFIGKKLFNLKKI